jgi:hypothetical protein
MHYCPRAGVSAKALGDWLTFRPVILSPIICPNSYNEWYSQGGTVSDFSGSEQSFALAGLPAMQQFEEAVPSMDVQPHEVHFRRLRGHREIAHVVPLRQQIALPASTVGDPAFATREKKEMKSVSSVR